MGESRTELLAWLNELLQTSYVKIEQCGTGGAYCQIIDSIYGDVPMSRVKMNAKHEYEFLANYKILQNVFKAHKIDKPIPVERLVKCKMQDNLEFLQWLKKYWDQNYGGQPYDAIARRKGVTLDTPATIAPVSRPPVVGAATNRAATRTPSGVRAGSSAASNEFVLNLQNQLREANVQMEGLEKERDFYFAKLRDIEILCQNQLEVLEAQSQDDPTLREIQKILYSVSELIYSFS
ncbi:calponin homology domain-containing protein [Cantharellus anzutake]|uniref:calponin homology domain-containing protein n=1 Tax=Cantharellus anzutake TaxID=1750568 RepID=UPI0019084FC6|nr:calponin homology domain-containing protein [Cantharellus anzutake]KAF8326990.1 calponin homology domain-containing protein [Cantharellus anzutake]